MNKQKTNITIDLGGLSFILFIVFLVLKLTDVITWSWWWVTAPLWISFGLSLVVLLIYTIVLLCIRSAHKREFNRMMRKRG